MIEEALDIALGYLAKAGGLLWFYLWSKLIIETIWVNEERPMHKTKIGIIITILICLIWSAFICSVIGFMMKEEITGWAIFFTGVVLSLVAYFKLYTKDEPSK